MTRLSSLVALLTIVLLTVSCNDEVPILFTYQQQTRIVVPAGLNTFSQHIFVERDVMNNYQLFRDNANASDSDVSSIEAGRARLIPTIGGYPFGIIDEVFVRIVDPEDPNQGREAFYRDQLTFQESDRLDLFGSISELKGLADLEFFDIELTFLFNSVTSESEEFILEYEFAAKGF